MLNVAMKYVQIDRNGNYRYRRGIPLRCRPYLEGKREFLKVIGTTEADAVSAYESVHRHFEEKLTAAKQYLEIRQGEDKADDNRVSYLKTVEDLRAFNTDSFSLSEGKKETWEEHEEEVRDAVADDLLSNYPAGIGAGRQYDDIPAQKMALIKSLYSGLDPANLAIADAFQFYLQNKAKPDPDARYRQEVRFKRHLKLLEECFGPNKAVASLNRQDARRVRDRLLDKNVTAQKKVTSATVDRYLCDIKAVFAYAALEHDIPYTNPFKALDLPKQATGDADLRDPLPDEVMQAVEADLAERQDQILLQLYTILKFTGARLGEITGLLVGETHLETAIPYIEIRRRPGRSLKNVWSQRNIPLTGSAVAAVRARLEAVQKDEHLFAKFARKNGGTLASARLMKAIRKQTKDKKHVAHSLRHNFRDSIRANHIPFELGKALEGRRYSSGEEARYGGGFTIEALYEAISKVNGET